MHLVINTFCFDHQYFFDYFKLTFKKRMYRFVLLVFFFKILYIKYILNVFNTIHSW